MGYGLIQLAELYNNGLLCVRLAMITCLSPILSRMGYGLTQLTELYNNGLLCTGYDNLFKSYLVPDGVWTQLAGLYNNGLLCVRLAMITCLSPILSRMGYGLSWQDSLVMAWGGLRGAMGLALALLVFYNPVFSHHLVGSKILIHTAAIVAATLLINATTIKFLLRKLGMTQVSNQRKTNMYNSVRHLRKAQERSIRVLKADSFLADSDWKFVEEFTTIVDIYQAEDTEQADEEDLDLLPLTLKCGVNIRGSIICPSKNELKEMVNNARIRLLHLLKLTWVCVQSSFWRQFELGLLTRDNVHQLMVIIDFAEDKEGQFLTINELLQNWNFRKYYWLVGSVALHCSLSEIFGQQHDL
ncbi:SLC9C1 [Cordylochernes scorpioides]|uniref:SLC9C1 n=1 Tax=Cordylochernes scorpioides TaxID=51811 RepID=A0ABY6LRK3_9ARAC|nr:SLC9C1 [Cordylochernes scorpioides]